MTCAKCIVTCTIVTDHGKFTGTNACAQPQTTCPREPGEGYSKCQSICQQEGQAEIIALRKAGEHAKGGYAIIRGIGHVCRYCQEALVEAGVRWFCISEINADVYISYDRMTWHPLNEVVHPVFVEGENAS